MGNFPCTLSLAASCWGIGIFSNSPQLTQDEEHPAWLLTSELGPGEAGCRPSIIFSLSLFFQMLFFQPSGLALSLMFYGTDVSISGGSAAVLWLMESSRTGGHGTSGGCCDPRESRWGVGLGAAWCQEHQGWVMLGNGRDWEWDEHPTGGVGREQEALLCKGKAILNNSSVAQEGENPQATALLQL